MISRWAPLVSTVGRMYQMGGNELRWSRPHQLRRLVSVMPVILFCVGAVVGIGF